MPVMPGDKPNTAAAIRFVERSWGVQCFGYATTGHVGNSDHYQGLALDCMTGDSRGDAIAQWFISNPNAFGTKYVIWQRRIWFPTTGWRPYNGTNPHTNHVHVSLLSTGGTGGNVASLLPIGLNISNPLTPITNVLGRLNDVVSLLNEPHFWFRVFMVLLGAVLILVGLANFLKVPDVATKTAKGLLEATA